MKQVFANCHESWQSDLVLLKFCFKKKNLFPSLFIEEDTVSITVTSELQPTNQDKCPNPQTDDLDCNGLLPKILKMKSPLIPESTDVEPVITPSPVNMDDIPLSKNPYAFELETKVQDEDDTGSQKPGSKLEPDQNMKPTEPEPGRDLDDVPLPENLHSLEQTSGFQDNDGECKKSPNQKRGNKPGSKSTSKKQKPKATVGENDTHTPLNVDDIPLPKTSYNFDPSQWDDPNFDPFGGKNKVRNSPTVPKASYDFIPDNVDDSLDAFKPSKKISESGDSERTNDEKIEEESKESPLVAERKVRQAPKKSKDKIIT